MSSADGEPHRERKKFNRASRACTYCRLKKYKCDGLTRFPSSCTRCEKIGQFCEFERVPKSAAISNGSTPKEAPKETPKEAPKEAPKDECREPTPPLADLVNGKAIPVDDQRIHRRDRYAFLYVDTPLDDVYVDNNLVADGVLARKMFRRFYTSFYRHLPVFVRDYLDPDLLVGSRRTVYWAILAVTAMVECPERSFKIIDQARQELHRVKIQLMSSTYVLDPQAGMSFIIASLIMCSWSPPPNLHTSRQDLAWFVAGNALYMGMQMGLHRASYREEYSQLDIEDSKERQQMVSSLCWAGIFYANEVQCCVGGMPNLAPMSRSVYNHLSYIGSKIPEVDHFTNQLRILHAIRNGINQLGNCEDSEIGLVDPEIRGVVHASVVANFSQLATSIGAIDDWTEMLFYMGKIQFHSFLLAQDTLQRDRERVAAPLFLVCVKAVRMFIKLVTQENNELRQLPTVYKSVPFMAVMILFGFTVSDFKNWVDVVACRNSVMEMFHFLEPIDDYFGGAKRACRMLEIMTQLQAQNAFQEYVFNIKTRLGASAYISLMLRVKRHEMALEKEKEKEQVEELPPPPQPTVELADDSAFNSFLSEIWDWELPIDLPA